ncbi:MAG: autotransporter assembly complex protein TamA [Roseinatronobacter sp.]
MRFALPVLVVLMARFGLRSGKMGIAAGVALCVSSASAFAFDDLRVTIRGGDSALERNIRAASLLQSARDEGLSDPFEVYTVARAEYGQLIGLFYEAGYFAPRISVRIDGQEAADISPLSPPRQIGVIEVVADPGPPFVFGRAAITPLAPGTSLPPAFARGQPAGTTLIRDTVGAALDDWRDLGHAKAEPVGQVINARHATAELDADITLAPGPRVRFGQLRPDGHVRTRPERVVEIAGLPTGQVYSPQDMRRAAERLRATGTFSSVALRQAEALNPDGTVDIDAAIVEAPLRRIGLGVELDTESGGKLTGFWLHRNLFGGAERLRVEGLLGGLGARQGGRDYRFQLEFARPATITPDTTLKTNLVLETEDERDFKVRRIRGDVGLAHRFNDRLTATAGIGFLVERADFGPLRAVQQDYRLFLLPLSVTYDRRDDVKSTTRGVYAMGELKPFLGLQGSDSGARISADLRAYRALDSDARLVLAARAQVGAIFGASLRMTPREFLFYSGGGGTVRGQPYRSLGVTSGGVASGGQGFAALSLEARQRMTDKLGIVAFVDTGRVSERALSGASGWHTGAGLGVRYESELGPLRLDIGFPVQGAARRGAQLYLGIGQSF